MRQSRKLSRRAVAKHLGMDKKNNKPKKSKYKNKEVVYDGIKFKSTKERDRYIDLLLLERDGQIKDLELQPRYKLIDGVKFSDGSRAKPALRYTADFRYIDCKTGQTVVEDVKSKITKESTDYKMRRHMMLAIHGIEVLET